jgi:hypothetical protein
LRTTPLLLTWYDMVKSVSLRDSTLLGPGPGRGHAGEIFRDQERQNQHLLFFYTIHFSAKKFRNL